VGVRLIATFQWSGSAEVITRNSS